jgi:translocation and assembly module TamB
VEVVRGDFFVFNTRYEVLSARIDFFDPRRINPVLNIQLETLVREYTISVGLEGTLDQLDLTLSSDPILSENEILRLLLQGAGRSLQIVQGPILGWIERTTRDLFSLDRVTLDTIPLSIAGRGSQTSPTLTLVKRLFDRLLLTYITTVGGSEKFQIFQGEVEISERVSGSIRTDDRGDVDTEVIWKFRMK